MPTFPNGSSMRSSSLITTKKRTAGGSDNEYYKKIIKTEKRQASPCPFTSSADCYSRQSSSSSSPHQREIGGVLSTCDYVYLSPPSYIKSPRIDNGDVADHLADILEEDYVEVYQNMCAAVNGLKERLIDAPFRRFNTFQDFEKKTS